jgi:hypothetical protein
MNKFKTKGGFHLSQKAGQAQDWYNQAWSQIDQQTLNKLNETYNIALNVKKSKK